MATSALPSLEVILAAALRPCLASGATAVENKLRDDERLAVERGFAMTWRGL